MNILVFPDCEERAQVWKKPFEIAHVKFDKFLVKESNDLHVPTHGVILPIKRPLKTKYSIHCLYTNLCANNA